MPRLLALLVVTVLVATACSDDEDAAPTTTAPSTSTTTTVADTAPETYCDGVTRLNVALDEIARTMLSTLSGEPPAAFILVLGDAVDLFDDTAALAPPEAADATRLLGDAYAGFEELLFEIDFMVADLPVDDPRAAALNAPAFTDAITTMTEACP